MTDNRLVDGMISNQQKRAGTSRIGQRRRALNLTKEDEQNPLATTICSDLQNSPINEIWRLDLNNMKQCGRALQDLLDSRIETNEFPFGKIVSFCGQSRCFMDGLLGVSALSWDESFKSRVTEFVALLDEKIEQSGDILDALTEEQRAQAENYLINLRIRLNTAQIILKVWNRPFPEYVFLNQLPKELEIEKEWIRSVEVLEDRENASEKVGDVFLCGALWHLSIRLVYWRAELQKEVGPHALALEDHYRIITNIVNATDNLIALAKDRERSPQTDEILGKVENLLTELHQGPFEVLKNGNSDAAKRRPFPKSNLIESEDIDHPFNKGAKAIIDDLACDSGFVADIAQRSIILFRECRVEISLFAWNSWLSVNRVRSDAKSDPLGDWLDSIDRTPASSKPTKAEEAFDEVTQSFDQGWDQGLASFKVYCLRGYPPDIYSHFVLQLLGILGQEVKKRERLELEDKKLLSNLIYSISEKESDVYGSRRERDSLLAGLLAIWFEFLDDSELPVFESVMERILTDFDSRKGQRKYFLQWFGNSLVPILDDKFLHKSEKKAKFLKDRLTKESVRWENSKFLEKLTNFKIPSGQ